MKIAKYLAYGLIRKFSYLFFIYLPYGRVTRSNKVSLKGRVILAPTHNNFYCDISVSGTEGSQLPKWMAKVGLFNPPLGPFLRFFGAYPIVRILDGGIARSNMRQLNQETFQHVINALQEEGLFCIFPEGNCLDRPGLNLPLKNGIATLALSAEEKNAFSLGLRVIPIGIEYNKKNEFGHGISVRYGKEIIPAAYQAQYSENPKAGIRLFMQDLTQSLLAVFPHFDTDIENEVSIFLKDLGICKDRLLFSKIKASLKNSKIWEEFISHALQFRDKFPDASGRFLGTVCEWRNSSFQDRFMVYFKTLAFLPIALHSIVHNFFASIIIHKLRYRLTKFETEFMTLHVLLAMLLLPIVYFIQFYLLNLLFHLSWRWFVFSYIMYGFICISSWAVEKRWNIIFYKTYANFMARIPITKERITPALADLEKLRSEFNSIVGQYL